VAKLGGLTLADVGELRLLREVLLPDVTAAQKEKCDDCAWVSIPGNEFLWSIDPCPRPVADLLDKCSPEVWGWYTAVINLSDIASCGGHPIAMLTSLELPGDTEVDFVRRFQSGLMSALSAFGVKLLGGNVKAAARFSATGTIVGVPGRNRITRTVEGRSCSFYLVGPSGRFWSAVVVEAYQRSVGLDSALMADLLAALLYPAPQVRAGLELGALPFKVGCMDCSDGVANALQQMATLNRLDIEVVSVPDWGLDPALAQIFYELEIPLANVLYGFGDWQLACLVPDEYEAEFKMRMSGFPSIKLGRATKGSGRVSDDRGNSLNVASLNENFRAGYNSVTGIDSLLSRFLREPIFG
jgi:thiamine-monophosphate kinase